MEAELKSYTKADVLEWISPRLKHSSVEALIAFTVKEWVSAQDAVLQRIEKKFAPEKIVVRSSTLLEDGTKNSLAGCFLSELGVEPSPVAIAQAVNRVIDSYNKVGTATLEDKILIQEHTKDIAISGVIFTRQIETNAPYYTINYDDKTGKTDTVTSGIEGRTVYISRFWEVNSTNRWYKLIKAVKEIENFFPDEILDIEFAITQSKRIVIFQVRPLAANCNIPLPDDDFICSLLEDMISKFERFAKPVPHLGGKTIIFGDMPDWNPSEIIGSRPNTLDYTLYSFIITDEIWHEARSSMGYYDVFPCELMVSFAKKPYIDTRASFNSFTPANISHNLRDKLINYYLQKLKDNPAHQDKVEFDILWTCFDLTTREELAGLINKGFTQNETDELTTALRDLTNSILIKSDDLIKDDIRLVKYLTDRRDLIMEYYHSHKKSPWNSFYTAYNLLQNCKRFGTLPFSRQARLAFIAKSFLVSLRKRRVISSDVYHRFLNSIRTVATNFKDDLALMQGGQLDQKIFLQRYGHLRSGTYDITASRYDKALELFESNVQAVFQRSDEHFSFDADAEKQINQIMQAERINCCARDLVRFMTASIQNREAAKFEFTKSLSDALELIAEAGAMIGFTREELSHADLSTLMKFRNPEHGDVAYAKKMIMQSIERHRKERSWYDAVILGPVITGPEDFYFVEPYTSIPNFITQKDVQGEVIRFEKFKHSKQIVLEGKIILLENADPGFDWIFPKNPLGVITKYGGAASHMAIRCAEFNIPAAIGIGEELYNSLKNIKKIALQCEKKIIKPISEY